MAFITKIETAQDLKNEFEAYNRDQYEMCTYEGLIEFTESIGEDQELDVIGWCCELQEEHPRDTVSSYEELEDLINEDREDTSEDGKYIPFETNTDLSEEEDEIVENYISERTCIICFNSETIAYLAF